MYATRVVIKRHPCAIGLSGLMSMARVEDSFGEINGDLLGTRARV